MVSVKSGGLGELTVKCFGLGLLMTISMFCYLVLIKLRGKNCSTNFRYYKQCNCVPTLLSCRMAYKACLIERRRQQREPLLRRRRGERWRDVAENERRQSRKRRKTRREEREYRNRWRKTGSDGRSVLILLCVLFWRKWLGVLFFKEPINKRAVYMH